MKWNRISWIVWSFALALVLAGCGYQAEHGHDHGTETAGDHEAGHDAQPAAPVVIDEAMQAKLTAADLVDGEADQVVENCPGCNLGMEGSPDNAVQVGDYELQFCSAACRDNFKEDLAGSLQALAVPEPEAAEAEQATP